MVRQRCGGNPLYAEELARYVTSAHNAEAATGGRAMPESPLALMESRLDALPPAHRATLADASVLGLVFPTSRRRRGTGGQPGTISTSRRT